MRAKEFDNGGWSIAVNPKFEELARACDNWYAMEYSPADIQFILNSPYSKPYRRPSEGHHTLYRCIFPDDKVAESERDTRGFVSYATTLRGAEVFRTHTAPNEPYYIIEKKLKPSDFLLNFTSLYEMVMKDMGVNYDTESEVWMKRTPYYTTHTEDEIIVNHYWPEEVTEETNKQVLSYVKRIHPKGEFTIDHSIMNHAEWELTKVPLSSLHIDTDEVSPYGQINYIDYDHVRNITANDIKNKPIVVDNKGWIIDGNHRAVAARDLGLTSIPAYVPAESEDDEQETYAQHMARINSRK